MHTYELAAYFSLKIYRVTQKHYLSLLVKIGFVANKNHGKVISILHPQYLSVKFLNFFITEAERTKKMFIRIISF